MKVQDYLGYKSTEDPLYKAEKLMVRAAPLVDPDDFENYLEAVEKYKDKVGTFFCRSSSKKNMNAELDMFVLTPSTHILIIQNHEG